MTKNELNSLHKTSKENELFGRYIQLKHVEHLLQKLPSKFEVEILGESVLKKNIYSVTIGQGSKKILMWSQMHGNESTTTKALFDLFNAFNAKNSSIIEILKSCTIKIIPILNPDGAEAYTRLNANKVDLNRDAQNLSQPESVVLRECFDDFSPDFCFNLHGQRTIFSAGSGNKVATVSFLSPAQDEACTITDNRKRAMEVIVQLKNMLYEDVPDQIGVYDDAFNLNCVGDTFQSLSIPTILFEAGHYSGDYEREVVRQFIFKSYITALLYISNNEVDGVLYEDYSLIPPNEKLFFDIIIRNVDYNNNVLDIAVQYEERLVNDKLEFIPKVEKIEKLDKYFAHRTIDANKNEVFNLQNLLLEVGSEIDCVKINNELLSLKLTKS